MKKKQLEQMVLESKEDKQKMNDLIETYKPFIVSCAQKLSGKYLTYGSDDELSVAMMAFVQAVYGYRTENGEFLSYASTVIRNSVIDYYRKQKSQNRFVYIDKEDGETEDLLETQVSLAVYDEEKLKQERLYEIQLLKETLAGYDINFFELEKVCPKNKNTRKICKDVVSFIKNNPELLNQTLANKNLPLSEIEKGLNIKRKKFERHRKYILAVLVILSGDYPYLEEYVK